jgi:hypothetical protein
MCNKKWKGTIKKNSGGMKISTFENKHICVVANGMLL